MWITFTEPVTLEYEQGDGPHYQPGYCVDVKGRVARGWIEKGVAVAGKVTVAPTEPDAPDAPDAETEDVSEPVDIPTFKRRRPRR